MHAIQSAYHWTDEQVFDIRLGRLVQIVNVLNATDMIRKVELEWSAKLIAATVASTVEDDKARDSLLKSIESMNLRGLSAAEMAAFTGGKTTAAGPGRGAADTSGDGRSIEEILEKGSVHQALARNLRRSTPGIFGMS